MKRFTQTLVVIVLTALVGAILTGSIALIFLP
jgi:hypothetical protein